LRLLLIFFLAISAFVINADNIQKRFYIAIKTDKKNIVKKIINNAPELVNSKIEYHSYPLLEALSKSKGEIALFFLDQGASVDIKDELIGGTPLQCLAKHSYKMNYEIFSELVFKLVDKGADLNEVDNDGFTPLDRIVSFAITEKNLPIILKKISIILKNGATLPQKENPILFSLLDGITRTKAGKNLPFLNVFKLLVKNGADINALNSKKYNILMKLFTINSKYIDVSERIKFADYILSNGIDINAVTPEKNTVLHLLLINRYKAISYKDKLNLTEYLIQNGAKTTLKNKKHENAKKLSKKNKKLYQVVIRTKKKKNLLKVKRK
jgi:ankyrin repeat protein